MAAACTNCDPKRIYKRSAEIHGKAARQEGWGHLYEHNPRPPMGTSETRKDYLKSDTHKDAMALSAGAMECWPAAYGAPGECMGAIGPSHILSSGAHGGLKAADKYPAPPACTWHNDAMEQVPEIREWAERTYFTFNGRQYPFKVTLEWLQAEKDGVRL